MKPTDAEIKLFREGRRIVGKRLKSGLMSPVYFEVIDEVGGRGEAIWSILIRAKHMDTGKENLWIVNPEEGWIFDFKRTPDELNPWAGQY
jgi:hypothetical protein